MASSVSVLPSILCRSCSVQPCSSDCICLCQHSPPFPERKLTTPNTNTQWPFIIIIIISGVCSWKLAFRRSYISFSHSNSLHSTPYSNRFRYACGSSWLFWRRLVAGYWAYSWKWTQKLHVCCQERYLVTGQDSIWYGWRTNSPISQTAAKRNRRRDTGSRIQLERMARNARLDAGAEGPFWYWRPLCERQKGTWLISWAFKSLRTTHSWSVFSESICLWIGSYTEEADA